MPKVCKFNRRPGGCKDINCKFRHPERSGKRHKVEFEFDKKKRKMVEKVILIPDQMVGKLLGPKGCRINEVKASCKAFINVSGPHDIVNNDKREITIRGTDEEIYEARNALFNSLLDIGIEYFPLIEPLADDEAHEDFKETLGERISSAELNKKLIVDKSIKESTTITKLETELKETKRTLEWEKKSLENLTKDIGKRNAELTTAEEKCKDLEEKIENVENQKQSYINEKEEYRKELEYSKAVLEETKTNHALSYVQLDKAKDTIKDLLEEQENLKKKHSSEIIDKDMEIMQINKAISDQEIRAMAEVNRLKQTIEEQKQNQQAKDDRIEELSREVLELQQEHRTLMTNKEMQKSESEKVIKAINEEAKILRLDKEKTQESLELLIKANENLKIEFQIKKEENEKAIEQLQAEMILNQNNLQHSFCEIKQRDLTIQRLQQKCGKIRSKS